MQAYESDHEDHPSLGLSQTLPAAGEAWFWVAHTARQVRDFIARENTKRCLTAGGGILLVSRGGAYAGWTAEALRAELADLDERLRPRIYVLPDRFVGETVERVKLFVERVVPGLEPHADIPWQELDRAPVPDALLAYHLLSLLEEPDAKNAREDLKGRVIAEIKDIAGAKEALKEDRLENPEERRKFLRKSS